MIKLYYLSFVIKTHIKVHKNMQNIFFLSLLDILADCNLLLRDSIINLVRLLSNI